MELQINSHVVREDGHRGRILAIAGKHVRILWDDYMLPVWEFAGGLRADTTLSDFRRAQEENDG